MEADAKKAACNESAIAGGRWSNASPWHAVMVQSLELSSVVNWDEMPMRENTLVGSIAQAHGRIGNYKDN